MLSAPPHGGFEPYFDQCCGTHEWPLRAEEGHVPSSSVKDYSVALDVLTAPFNHAMNALMDGRSEFSVRVTA